MYENCIYYLSHSLSLSLSLSLSRGIYVYKFESLNSSIM
jgi:hypothetical protein